MLPLCLEVGAVRLREGIDVADVDGDASAEVVRVSNSANWNCDAAPWNAPDMTTGRVAWAPPNQNQNYYRGISVFGERSWAGTRPLWNEHSYSVTNVCSGIGNFCEPGEEYGVIPQHQKPNWAQAPLNNFRQNMADTNVLDAADATVSVVAECSDPIELTVTVRNVGLAPLPPGVAVDVKIAGGATIGQVMTSKQLLPGQAESLPFTVPMGTGTSEDLYSAEIVSDDLVFVECDDGNNESAGVAVPCSVG